MPGTWKGSEHVLVNDDWGLDSDWQEGHEGPGSRAGGRQWPVACGGEALAKCMLFIAKASLSLHLSLLIHKTRRICLSPAFSLPFCGSSKEKEMRRVLWTATKPSCFLKRQGVGILLWCSGLRIQCCYNSCSGCCCGVGLIPGPRPFIGHWQGQKKKKKTGWQLWVFGGQAQVTEGGRGGRGQLNRHPCQMGRPAEHYRSRESLRKERNLDLWMSFPSF